MKQTYMSNQKRVDGKMKSNKVMAAILANCTAALFLSGCATGIENSQKPVAANFAKQDQLKLQSASHWQIIADDVSSDLVKSLVQTQATKRVFVIKNEIDSDFQKAFKQQLVSSLMKSGYTVLKTNDESALSIEVSAQPLHFSKTKRDPFFGEATALTTGLWVFKNVFESSPITAVMGAAIAYDTYNVINSKHNTKKPKTELVVTVSAFNEQQYYANVSNVYYTTDSDTAHFTNAYKATQFNVKGDD